MQRASTIWTPLLIVESQKCYPSGKGKTMELLKDFLIDDIKIPAEFKTTEPGVRKVRVVGVMRQQCPEYGKKLQRVLRIERKGRLYGNGQERAETSKRYTPEVQ